MFEFGNFEMRYIYQNVWQSFQMFLIQFGARCAGVNKTFDNIMSIFDELFISKWLLQIKNSIFENSIISSYLKKMYSSYLNPLSH